MTPRELLTFLDTLANLKDTPRHCKTKAGNPETVAAHSWRLAVMALLLAPEFPSLDMDRVMRMCLIHDFGEAITGDIPSFIKTSADERAEERLLDAFVDTLPPPQSDALHALYAEMDALETEEARLYKLLDRLEAVIAHNESDIQTWIPLEYELNRTYAIEQAAAFPFTRALRAEMLADTLQKIEAAGGMPAGAPSGEEDP